LWAGPTGAIVVIEPNPRVWPNARAIWSHNEGLAPIVDYFVGFAAADTELFPVNDDITHVSMDMGGWPLCAYGDVIGDHGFRHLAQEADATPRTTLDDLLLGSRAKGRTVDVITIDIEGAEYEALKGAREVLQRHRPTVFVSVHPEFMRDMFKQHPDELHTFMDSVGYHSRLLNVDHEWHYEYTPR